jgi:hypothetical protein
MADTQEYNVYTVEEFIHAVDDIWSGGAEHTTRVVNIKKDLDFNQSPYYFWQDYFMIINRGDCTINGENHTISNVFIYPDKAFISVSNGSKLNINDLTFELISNNAYIINENGGGTCNYTNCIFNVKVYNFRNTLFAYSFSNLNVIYAVNCVYNIFINSMSNASTYRPNIISGCTDRNSYTQSSYNIFEACIFKIRNSTDRPFTLFADGKSMNFSGANNTQLDNCAIFYNEVGDKSCTEPIYLGKTGTAITSSSGFPVMYNTYIASFGELGSKSKPTLLLDARSYRNLQDINNVILSSFFDKNKIRIAFNNTETDFPEDGYNLHSLTTAQCKDRNKLSEIGYIFAEET